MFPRRLLANTHKPVVEYALPATLNENCWENIHSFIFGRSVKRFGFRFPKIGINISVAHLGSNYTKSAALATE